MSFITYSLLHLHYYTIYSFYIMVKTDIFINVHLTHDLGVVNTEFYQHERTISYWYYLLICTLVLLVYQSSDLYYELIMNLC